SLVQALEEDGIGRPSTYAPTISTIQARGYVVREEKKLVPTEIGMQVNDLMQQYFPDIVDYQFTARMEEDLDMIASGQAEWVEVLHEFYHPFEEDLKKAQAEMPVTKSGPEPIGRKCPEDGGELVIRYGRFGKFISCSNFPTCRYTEPWLEKIGIRCPKDGGELVERRHARAAPSMAAKIIPIAISLRGSGRSNRPVQNAAACLSLRINARSNVQIARKPSFWKPLFLKQ